MTELPTQMTPEQAAALEAALAARAGAQQPEPSTTGNFNGMMVDPNLLHLYQRAKLEHTPQGDKWVVELTEYFTATKPYGNQRVSLDKNGMPKNLGEYITMVINNPEGWVLFNVLPNGAGMGVAVFKRVVRQALPDPELADTQTEVGPVVESELSKMAEAALRWEANEFDDTDDDEDTSGDYDLEAEVREFEADMRDLAASDAAVEGADSEPERQ